MKVASMRPVPRVVYRALGDIVGQIFLRLAMRNAQGLAEGEPCDKQPVRDIAHIRGLQIATASPSLDREE
jgi:hypothetical protein